MFGSGEKQAGNCHTGPAVSSVPEPTVAQQSRRAADWLIRIREIRTLFKLDRSAAHELSCRPGSPACSRTPLLVIECAIGSDHSGTAIRRPTHGYQNGSLLSRRPPECNSRPQFASRASCSESPGSHHDFPIGPLWPTGTRTRSARSRYGPICLLRK